MAKKRIYRKGVEGSEYAYGATPKAKAARVKRNAARREAIREGLVSKGTATNKSTTEVGHKTPLSRGGSNDKSNIEIQSRSENRKQYNKTKAEVRSKKTAKKKGK
jgi:5-methylcytosine-specific restriction endonuclease McrA